MLFVLVTAEKSSDITEDLGGMEDVKSSD
jgi:hypothetical protein